MLDETIVNKGKKIFIITNGLSECNLSYFKFQLTSNDR